MSISGRLVRRVSKPKAQSNEENTAMRKLKLQMQSTVDGFVAGAENVLDWATVEMDDKLLAFINHLTDTSDTILLGRKMTPEFIKYWENVPKDSPEYEFAQKMVQTPKVA